MIPRGLRRPTPEHKGRAQKVSFGAQSHMPRSGVDIRNSLGTEFLVTAEI